MDANKENVANTPHFCMIYSIHQCFK